MRLTARSPRFLLLLLAFLPAPLAGCGGGAEEVVDHVLQQGTVVVINETGAPLDIIRLQARNGSAEVYLVPPGGTATFSNVEFGPFVVSGIDFDGTVVGSVAGVLDSPHVVKGLGRGTF